MKKKTKHNFRIGSLSDSEVFEIDLTKMSTEFMSAYLSRKGRYFTLDDDSMKEIAKKSVELAHHLMIEVQECVEQFEKDSNESEI